MPKYTWNESKRLTNLRKHGIDFRDVDTIFERLTLTMEDDRFEYAEQRFITFGLLGEMVVAIAHTEVDDVIRVISIRKAERLEQKNYFQSIAN